MEGNAAADLTHPRRSAPGIDVSQPTKSVACRRDREPTGVRPDLCALLEGEHRQHAIAGELQDLAPWASTASTTQSKYALSVARYVSIDVLAAKAVEPRMSLYKITAWTW